MATRSAAKAHRQSLKRRLRNRSIKSQTKTYVKKAEEAIAGYAGTVAAGGGDPEAVRLAVRKALSALDRAATKGVLHPNNAARSKSRLVLKYNAAMAVMQAVSAPSEPAISEEEAPKRRTRRKKSE